MTIKSVKWKTAPLVTFVECGIFILVERPPLLNIFPVGGRIDTKLAEPEKRRSADRFLWGGIMVNLSGERRSVASVHTVQRIIILSVCIGADWSAGWWVGRDDGTVKIVPVTNVFLQPPFSSFVSS
jgi:hypothetical protein